MKFFSLFAFLGFIAAVSAIPASPFLTSTSNMQSRESWEAEYIRESSLVPEEYLEERNPSSDVDYLHARDIDIDSELSEREYFDLEERNPAVVVRVAVQAIKLIVKAIRAAIDKDKKMRGEWSKHMIDKLRAKYPHHNFVVCHTKHKTNFKGQRGKDWGHSHQELNVSFHKTIGFEIYWFKEGTFNRIGDGGYLNWAYGGNILSKTNGGKTVKFGRL